MPIDMNYDIKYYITHFIYNAIQLHYDILTTKNFTVELVSTDTYKL